MAGLLSLLSYFKDASALAGLVFVVWLFLSDRIVTRRHMDERLAERDIWLEEWKRVALGMAEAAKELAPDAREGLRVRRGQP